MILLFELEMYNQLEDNRIMHFFNLTFLDLIF